MANKFRWELLPVLPEPPAASSVSPPPPLPLGPPSEDDDLELDSRQEQQHPILVTKGGSGKKAAALCKLFYEEKSQMSLKMDLLLIAILRLGLTTFDPTSRALTAAITRENQSKKAAFALVWTPATTTRKQ
jgi:hypothetical protein